MSEMHISETPLPAEVKAADPLEVAIADLFAERSETDIRAFAESVAPATGHFGDMLRRAITHAAVEKGEMFGLHIMNIFENDAFQTSMEYAQSPAKDDDDLPELGSDFHPQDVGA